MYPEGAKRRTVLKTVGAAVGSLGVVGTASAGGRGNGNEPLKAQLQQIEKATKRYKDIRQALREGYQIMGPYVPNMGWHLANFEGIERANQHGVNLAKPPGLTYNFKGKLGSVEYITALDDESPDVFNDEGEDLKASEDYGWHPHHGAQHVYAKGGVEDPDDSSDNYENASVKDLLTPAHWMELSDELQMFPPEMNGLEVGDEVTLPWPPNFDVETRTVDGLIEHDDWWTLHVWVHIENPHGVFAPFNPSSAFDPFPGPGSDGHDH